MIRTFLTAALILVSFLFFIQDVSADNDLKSVAIKKLQASVVNALPTESSIIRVAILDLEGDNGSIRNAITSAITEKTTFKVIERSDLDKILEEQGLQLKDIIDEKTSITHGRIKGVQGLIMGKVVSMEEGFMSYTIKMNLKLDDVEKGEIVLSREIEVTAESTLRNWIIYGGLGFLIVLIAFVIFRKSRPQLIREDLIARIDMTKEIDKAVTNISGARSKLNSIGKTEEAIKLNNVEGDLLQIKQLVQTAYRGSALKTRIKDYKKVLVFDEKIITSFEALSNASDRMYAMVTSENSSNLEKEIDIMKKDISNLLNEFRNRGF
jgi:hypothetical protein